MHRNQVELNRTELLKWHMRLHKPLSLGQPSLCAKISFESDQSLGECVTRMEAERRGVHSMAEQTRNWAQLIFTRAWEWRHFKFNLYAKHWFSWFDLPLLSGFLHRPPTGQSLITPRLPEVAECCAVGYWSPQIWLFIFQWTHCKGWTVIQDELPRGWGLSTSSYG